MKNNTKFVLCLIGLLIPVPDGIACFLASYKLIDMTLVSVIPGYLHLAFAIVFVLTFVGMLMRRPWGWMLGVVVIPASVVAETVDNVRWEGMHWKAGHRSHC